IAVVATINRHGHPHLTPNWYRYDGKVLTLITRKDRLKYRFCGTFCSGGQEGAVAPVCREAAAARAANWAAAGRPSWPSAPRRGRVFLMGKRALPPRGAGAASTAVPPHRDRGQRGTPRGAGATMVWRTLPVRLPPAG